MRLSNWLADRLGIHLNLRPLAAPAGAIVGGLLGGPAGAALGAGLMKTGDNLAHGDSVGHAIGQGALNAGIAGIGAGGLQELRGAFSGGGAAADATGAFTPSSAVGAATGAAADTAPGSWSPLTAGAQAAPSGGTSMLGSIGGGIKDTASWLASHPQAPGMALQGAGQIATSGSQNALLRAQAMSANLNNQNEQYAQAAKKARDAALAPLIASFQGQAQKYATNPYPIAPNPYTTGASASPYG